LALYMLSSDTARVGIIKRAKYPQVPPIIRYKDARGPICTYLADSNRRVNPLIDADDWLQRGSPPRRRRRQFRNRHWSRRSAHQSPEGWSHGVATERLCHSLDGQLHEYWRIVSELIIVTRSCPAGLWPVRGFGRSVAAPPSRADAWRGRARHTRPRAATGWRYRLRAGRYGRAESVMRIFQQGLSPTAYGAPIIPEQVNNAHVRYVFCLPACG
jgi:hypothetical protein